MSTVSIHLYLIIHQRFERAKNMDEEKSTNERKELNIPCLFYDTLSHKITLMMDANNRFYGLALLRAFACKDSTCSFI